MPKFALQVSCQLQNLTSLLAPAPHPWEIELRCTGCGETSKPIVSAEHVSDGIRGASVHLKYSCKLCKRENTVTILEENLPYSSDISPAWGDILKIECRGCEPLSGGVRTDLGVTLSSEKGVVEEEAVIDDGEWYGYDEDSGQEVSLTEFMMQFIKT